VEKELLVQNSILFHSLQDLLIITGHSVYIQCSKTNGYSLNGRFFRTFQDKNPNTNPNINVEAVVVLIVFKRKAIIFIKWQEL